MCHRHLPAASFFRHLSPACPLPRDTACSFIIVSGTAAAPLQPHEAEAAGLWAGGIIILTQRPGHCDCGSGSKRQVCPSTGRQAGGCR